MSTDRLSTAVDVSMPDDDEPDAYALWEAGEGPMPDWVPAAAAQAGGTKSVAAALAETKLAHDVSRELRDPKGSHTGGRFTKNPAGPVASAVAGIALGTRTGKAGPTGNFDADAKRVLKTMQAHFEAGRDTETRYDHVDGAPGKYTAAREAQQRKVIDHFLNAPGVKSERKILVMGGLPGAGKTSFLNSDAGKKALGNTDLKGYVVVNSDEVKAYMAAHDMVPAYQGLTPGEAVGLYHEEAAMISKAIMEAAAAQGKNIIYDVTLKNPEQATKATDILDRNGDHYDRTMVFVDVPVATAVERAKGRYTGGEGRFVPISNIESQADPSGKYHSLNRAAFEKVKGTASNYVIVDNTNADGKGPKIVEQGKGGHV